MLVLACRYVRDTPLKKDKPWELLTFCIETSEGAEATSKRLKHMYKPMLRKLPDGSSLTWKVATMSCFEESNRAPKPFFISWDDPTQRPDKASSMLLHSSCYFYCYGSRSRQVGQITSVELFPETSHICNSPHRVPLTHARDVHVHT